MGKRINAKGEVDYYWSPYVILFWAIVALAIVSAFFYWIYLETNCRLPDHDYWWEWWNYRC